jgi:hypothetical protein
LHLNSDLPLPPPAGREKKGRTEEGREGDREKDVPPLPVHFDLMQVLASEFEVELRSPSPSTSRERARGREGGKEEGRQRREVEGESLACQAATVPPV